MSHAHSSDIVDSLDGLRRVPDHAADIIPYSRIDDFPDTVDGIRKKDHYEQRERERTDPSLDDDLVETVLQDGYVELHDGDDPFARASRRHLKCTVDGHRWSIVVEVFSGGATGATPGFSLITGFCPAHKSSTPTAGSTSDPDEAVARFEQTVNF